ncbi:DUF4398 domain-containing protein [Thiopseudomonas alkaliphila]|uniref:Chromosome partitioning protein ParA n=1 Tax=Thiopseudomonas alkaliphila TaxID=1697053 RepID=A0A0K1XCB0_9GAMM|nr:DUF4398 domain-containing protein [Thiopseudomonas alkaliphila]AKX58823.1 chromosome partitioning protein ParA [Thiopseudomonas alkaliphila]MDM1715550.1 DUF4398 domain-containing protein [Thiopseudomonas alkaliphila]
MKKSLLKNPKTLLAAVVAGSVLTLAGCSGNPPTTQLAVATQALNAAETAGAIEFAPVEMQAARQKMNQAEKADFEKDYKKAKDLAEQAEWDARVAERKAQAEKVQRAVKDAERAVQELRNEGMRGSK